MDILYYSNMCKYSQQIIQYFVKNNLVDKLHFLCVDKRRTDQVTGQLYLQLENGSEIMLPPNVHSVPSLLLIKENYTVLYGKEIMDRFKSNIENDTESATRGNGEPLGFVLSNNSSVNSEKFTYFQASVEDLSTKGYGGLRALNNYVSVDDSTSQYTIHTPPETYKSNKIDNNMNLEKVEQKRNSEISQNKLSPFIPPTSTNKFI
jgi:hypothetical protein